MATRRQYSGTAPATVLQTSMTASAPTAGGTINVSTGTGANYPDGSVGPFFIVIDRGLSTEEKLLITSRTNDTFTISSRGADGTAGASHISGSAVIEHVVTKTDLDEANAHVTVTTQDDHTQYLNIARHDVTARHPASVLDMSAIIPTGTMWMTANAAAPSGWVLCDGSAISRTGGNAALFAAIGTTYGAGDGSTTFNVPDMRGRVPVGVGTGTGGGASGTGLPTGGSALTARARGGWTGEETHALTGGETGAHSHTTTESAHNHTQNQHNHGTTESNHGHGITDPQHNHQTGGSSFVWAPAGAQAQRIPDAGSTSNGVYVTYTNINAASTGVSVNGASTGLTVNNNTPTNVAASTGLSVNATGAASGHNTIQPQMCVNFIIKL